MTVSSLIPKADQYYDLEYNVLLIGLHGVGKTEAIVSLAREKGAVLKYYSCSTLDPFTDLVGVPTPRYYDTVNRIYFNTPTHPTTGKHISEDPTVVETLRMVRPRDVDEAEFIFFDEFNRGDEKTQNAIFEIIQFGTINGEKLPNLKCCWAAMNPPDGDYKVSDLDPALIDRFDTFIDIQAKPSVAYMSGPGGLPKPIAQALYSWWGEHNTQRRGMENFISPRRLMKIGRVFHETGDFRPALPKWINADRSKLAALLDRAKEDVAKNPPKTGKLGDGPNPSFQYDETWLAEKRMTVAKYMENNPEDFDTHNAVLSVIESKQGRTLARDYAELLEALKPALLEGFISRLNAGKLNSLTEAVKELPSHRYDTLTNLRRELSLA
jgi:DNA polymerase III delta prime subunit